MLYRTSLRQVARAVGNLIRGFDLTDPGAAAQLEDSLFKYATILEPWAEAVGRRMLTDVAARAARAWFEAAREMGVSLRAEIETAPTGQILRQARQDQVSLITSLPTQAAE